MDLPDELEGHVDDLRVDEGKAGPALFQELLGFPQTLPDLGRKIYRNKQADHGTSSPLHPLAGTGIVFMCMMYRKKLPFLCIIMQDRQIFFHQRQVLVCGEFRGGKRLAEQPELIVYTLEYCPNCETLKEYLSRKGLSYQERDMSGAAALTELRINGIFVNEAPVLQAGSVFLVSRDLFSAGILNEDRVLQLSEGS